MFTFIFDVDINPEKKNTTTTTSDWVCRVGAAERNDFKRILAEKHKRARSSKYHQLKWGRRENQHENIYRSNKYKYIFLRMNEQTNELKKRNK